MIRALALTGPTASGKTALSLSLAEKLGGEIISCDSMQIYRGMDIGTAKATEEERARAPHHMLDICSPDEIYSAEDYARDATAVARDISARGNTPIFVGGTGLYIDTVMRGGAPISPPSDAALREELMKTADEDRGAHRLWEMLLEVDPESAEKIHENNVRRVVRALEIYRLSGKTKTYFDQESKKNVGEVSVGLITLDFHDRDNLYRRVDLRVDIMANEGLVAEVESLWRRGLLKSEYTSAQAIGYKEIIAYLEGRTSLAEAIDEIKLASRRYAKRQLTWFRHEKDAVRIYVDDELGVMKSASMLEREALAAVDNLLVKRSDSK